MENSTSHTRTRTNSALKWLANEGAAVLGELELVRNALGALQQRETRLRADLDALDASIQRFDAELDPTLIRPVRAWKERNNGRGRMEAYFLAVLEQAGEVGLTVSMVTDMWAAEVGDLAFTVGAERSKYIMNRTKPCLRRLKDKGLAKCDPIPGGGHNDFVWRIAPGVKASDAPRRRRRGA